MKRKDPMTMSQVEEMNKTIKERRESLPTTSREKREQDQIDVELRSLINELLNSRMEDPKATEEKVDELEKKWFKFCIKPRKVGLMGSTWKKIKPSKRAFRYQANHFIERFDAAQKEQLEAAPKVKESINYKFK